MNHILKSVRESVAHIENGFKPMEKESKKIFSNYSGSETLKIAQELYLSKEHQLRMVAVFLFGYLSSTDDKVLRFMKERVSLDEDWRVQEILGMAFDYYCRSVTYEKAIPTIEDWLNSPVANARRAVTEGLRIWTSRPYFIENPEKAVSYLSALKDDESEYVRKSVGNALRDISKKHEDLIKEEISKWNLSDKSINQTYKLVIKNGLLKK